MLWVLFTFPSRYLSTIGLGRVFSLGGWARRIHTGFHVPRATQDAGRLLSASRTGLSPSPVRLSRRFRSPSSCHIPVLQPRGNLNPPGLGSSPVARHYWGNHILFSLPLGTKMFQFPRFASILDMDGSPSDCRVAPFGNLRIKGRLRLPGAFRSLPRPSSPSRATGIRRAPFLAFACPASTGRGAHTLEFALLSELGIYSVSLLFHNVNDRM